MAKSKSSLFGTDNSAKGALFESSPSNSAGKAPDRADDIIDINLSAIRKKRFRINGDSDHILELNTSDMGIVSRLDAEYRKLNLIVEEVSKVLKGMPDNADDITDIQMDAIKETLDRLNSEMRGGLDRIFEANVAEICAPFGNMWDVIDGQLRYEYIINVLLALYEKDISSEFSKMKSRVNNRVGKFIKGS